MRNLIFADVKRILRKWSYLLFLGITCIISLIWAIHTKSGTCDGFNFVSDQVMGLNTADTILGIVIYISVYADEFTSNSMQCLIGRGISRLKILICKFTDCVIITLISFGVYALFVTFAGLIVGVKMTGAQATFLYGEIFAAAIKSLGYATMSMIILFWTKNVAFATAADVLMIFSGQNTGGILTKLPVIKFMHPDRHLFTGAISCANVDLQLVGGSAIFTSLWILVKVCVVSLLLSYLLFRKKELDF